MGAVPRFGRWSCRRAHYAPASCHLVFSEDVLGVKVCGDTMSVDPVLPSSWDKVTVRYRHGKALYEITLENPDGLNRGVAWVEMDVRRLENTAIPLDGERINHRVRVQLGTGG